MNIQLNFRNQSSDSHDNQVVIFQRNVAGATDELAVAWKVIPLTGTSDQYRFEFPIDNTVDASDSTGVASEAVPAAAGQLLRATAAQTRLALAPAGTASHPEEIQIGNLLAQRTISVAVYKDGALLAIQPHIAPQQKAVFAFNTSLWIGLVPRIEAGQVIDPATLAGLDTELSLVGIASADIVMSGGGASAVRFALDNIVRA